MVLIPIPKTLTELWVERFDHEVFNKIALVAKNRVPKIEATADDFDFLAKECKDYLAINPSAPHRRLLNTILREKTSTRVDYVKPEKFYKTKQYHQPQNVSNRL